MEKAILVGAELQQDVMIDYYMDELQSLAEASNIEVVYTVTQALHKITPNFYIGSGKVNEIKSLVANLDATMVIFNDELSGSQTKNLEDELNCRVIDRTLLILDIFATRAKTKEAMLQVEIAQLEYLRPRLAGSDSSLGRQQGGIGQRGPGEKKLETDRRKIHQEIAKLKQELQEVVLSRQIQRKNRERNAVKQVAVVGYTNAGKSTLLNNVLRVTANSSDKNVFVKDMLFATLETATRSVELESKKQFILTDTVGFVSNLPHHLVESFKSTLEEITEADLLVHVVDASNMYYEKQIEVTNEILEDIGVHDIPILYVYNKQDLVTHEIHPKHFPNVIVSVLEEKGVNKVLSLIEKELFKDYEEVTLLIPFNEGELVSHFNEHAHIISQDYTNEGTLLCLELSPIEVKKYANYMKKGSVI